MKLVVVLAAAMLAVSPCLAAETFVGVPEISDADTVLIGGHRLRLAGADAPETDQVCLDAKGETYDCGIVARDAMAKAFDGKEWRCVQVGYDAPDRRPVTRCEIDGRDYSRWLVEQGLAIGDPRFPHPYDREQEEARKAKRGLWSGSFHAPWDWRHHTCETTIYGAESVPLDARAKLCPQVAESQRPKDPACAIKGNMRSKGGCIFHEPRDSAYFKLDMTKPGHRWFCSEADAIGAGCRRAYR